MLNESDLIQASDAAMRLSGYSDQIWLHPVDDETQMVFRPLSKSEFAALWNGLNKGGAAAQNARRMALSRATLIPDLVQVNAICQRFPGLPQSALDPILRLCGAGDWTREPEWFYVDDASTALLIEYVGAEAARDLVSKYPRKQQLAVVVLEDVALDVARKAYVLKTPVIESLEMFERHKDADDLYDAIVGFVTDAMAFPSEEKAIGTLFKHAPALPTTLRIVLQKMVRPAREAAGKGWRRSSARSPT